jgi:EAL domain-containing protein (putative c-di-GMP-specific phosphodiesterase class I)
VYLEIPTYHERLDQLTEQLREHGHLGLVLIDASELAQVEHEYGSKAFEQVLSLVSGLVRELQGAEVRSTDLLALNERGGTQFLLFLSPRRGEADGRPRIADLETIRARVEDQVNRKLAELNSQYIHGTPRVTVGYGVVFYNPMSLAERVVARLVKEASESVEIQKAQALFQTRCRLQDVMLGQQITTVFQPIFDLQRGGIYGFEALSRGPAGTQQNNPLRLFEAAHDTGLTFELDRHCRRQALRTARELPSPLRLFVNVVPQSIHDPDFQGASLISLLEGLGLSPGRIVLEISEGYAIENYTLFVEAMQNFTQIGFSVAVDDIGKGHSGLENIANLQPRYLKFDRELIRDIDRNPVTREMVRALKTFADKIDSQIIAEGIEKEEERQACADLGLPYGQGYLLARPAPIDSFTPGIETGRVSVRG